MIYQLKVEIVRRALVVLHVGLSGQVDASVGQFLVGDSQLLRFDAFRLQLHRVPRIPSDDLQEGHFLVG